MSENQSQFVEFFSKTQREAHIINADNGWWRERTEIAVLCQCEGINYWPHLAIEIIGLIHTEPSEAIEAARKHDQETWGDWETKDTMVRELAGTVVRIMDMAEYFGLPLAKAIEAEIEANRGRGHMHGGKKA